MPKFANKEGQTPRDVAASEADAADVLHRETRWVQFKKQDKDIEQALESWIRTFREREPHRLEFISAVRKISVLPTPAPFARFSVAISSSSSSSASTPHTSDNEGLED